MGTPLRLYNTLTRTKVDFEPIDASNVRMYVCGPTVYDFAHIGNARPAIVFDVLFRLLRHLYGAEHVTYARNITDVDDKINARALRDYPGLPLNEAIRKVTEKTDQQYQKDTLALGCLEPTEQPRATDNIAEMVTIIEKLIERGHAYVADGEVLFDTRSMPDYGALSRRNLDEQQAGARVAVEAHKKNPGDFVLWKLSAGHEPGWESPWGRGRPGWHIECSAMSERYLGQTFDIHGGGLDLIFPHHENEIAQSRCAHGTSVMANVWMHNGFLQIEGRKMSKSDGNFFTIHELLETESFAGRTWPGEVLRLAMLMTHYREPIDFSARRLQEAEAKLGKYHRLIEEYVSDALLDPPEDFLEVLKDDLNIPAAITIIDRYAVKASGYRRGEPGVDYSTDAATLIGENRDAAYSVASALNFLGLQPKKAEVSADLTSAVDALVAMRLEMLKAKNFAEADKIRNDLAEKGIQLKDGKGADGERVTVWEVKR